MKSEIAECHARMQNASDVVTEMQAVKHPYRDGVSAQKGIEF